MKRLKSIYGHPEATRPDYRFWSITGRLELIEHARNELRGSRRILRKFDDMAEASAVDPAPTVDGINIALEYGLSARKREKRLRTLAGAMLGGLALGGGILWTANLIHAQDQEQADHKQVVTRVLQDPFVLEDLGICESELRAEEDLVTNYKQTYHLSRGMPGPSDYAAAVHLAAEKNFPCDGRTDEVTYFVDNRKVVIKPADVTEFNLSDICETAAETRTARGWIAAGMVLEAGIDC